MTDLPLLADPEAAALTVVRWCLTDAIAAGAVVYVGDGQLPDADVIVALDVTPGAVTELAYGFEDLLITVQVLANDRARAFEVHRELAHGLFRAHATAQPFVSGDVSFCLAGDTDPQRQTGPFRLPSTPTTRHVDLVTASWTFTTQNEPAP